MRLKHHLALIAGFAAFLSACTPGNTPDPVKRLRVDTVFTMAQVEAYGTHYPGLEKNVFSLDLYSKGLNLDSGYIQGIGTNLYFSDIFLPTATSGLSEGEYRLDTTAQAMTVLPGMDFEGNISGAYLLLIQESSLAKIYLFRSGTFTLRQEGDTAQMDFHLVTDDQQTYDATFRGILELKKK